MKSYRSEAKNDNQGTTLSYITEAYHT